MDYYNAACQYGDRKLQDACIRWFLVNLMSHYYTHSDMELRTIPISLMTKLVAHPDLFTIQTEYSIYVMLKYWIYTMHHADDGRPSISTVNEFFTNREGWLDKSSSNESYKNWGFVQIKRLICTPAKVGNLCRFSKSYACKTWSLISWTLCWFLEIISSRNPGWILLYYNSGRMCLELIKMKRKGKWGKKWWVCLFTSLIKTNISIQS